MSRGTIHSARTAKTSQSQASITALAKPYWRSAADHAQAVIGNRALGALLTGEGRPLPAALRQTMEARFGVNFRAVRIRTDAAAANTAASLAAKAVTVGNTIAFGPNGFTPELRDGQHLIAHELAHVVQQFHGGSATPALAEAEAEHAADATTAGRETSLVNGVAPGSVQCDTDEELRAQLAENEAAASTTDLAPEGSTELERRHLELEAQLMRQTAPEAALTAANTEPFPLQAEEHKPADTRRKIETLRQEVGEFFNDGAGGAPAWPMARQLLGDPDVESDVEEAQEANRDSGFGGGPGSEQVASPEPGHLFMTGLTHSIGTNILEPVLSYAQSRDPLTPYLRAGGGLQGAKAAAPAILRALPIYAAPEMAVKLGLNVYRGYQRGGFIEALNTVFPAEAMGRESGLAFDAVEAGDYSKAGAHVGNALFASGQVLTAIAGGAELGGTMGPGMARFAGSTARIVRRGVRRTLAGAEALARGVDAGLGGPLSFGGMSGVPLETLRSQSGVGAEARSATSASGLASEMPSTQRLAPQVREISPATPMPGEGQIVGPDLQPENTNVQPHELKEVGQLSRAAENDQIAIAPPSLPKKKPTPQIEVIPPKSNKRNASGSGPFSKAPGWTAMGGTGRNEQPELAAVGGGEHRARPDSGPAGSGRSARDYPGSQSKGREAKSPDRQVDIRKSREFGEGPERRSKGAGLTDAQTTRSGKGQMDPHASSTEPPTSGGKSQAGGISKPGEAPPSGGEPRRDPTAEGKHSPAEGEKPPEVEFQDRLQEKADALRQAKETLRKLKKAGAGKEEISRAERDVRDKLRDFERENRQGVLIDNTDKSVQNVDIAGRQGDYSGMQDRAAQAESIQHRQRELRRKAKRKPRDEDE